MPSSRTFPRRKISTSVGPYSGQKTRLKVNHRTLHEQKSTSNHVENGISLSIIGWRWTKGDEKELLVRYCRAEPQSARGVYVHAIVDGKDISHSLTKEYPFSNSKKLPSSEYLNRLDGRRIVSILEFAWKSRGNLFEHNVIWDDLKTKEDAWAVDAHNACKVSKILENLLCYVKWKDGCTTWESGLAVTQFVGRTAFILCMGLGFRRTIQKWQHLQTSKAASTSQGFEVDNTEILRNSGDDSSECEGSAVSIGGKTPRRPLRYQKWTASNSWIEAVKGANPRDAFDSLLSDFDSMSRKGGIKVRCVGLMVKSDEQDGVRIARKMNRETVAATAKLFHHLLPKDPANVLNVAYLW